jgi:hypothetical protein
LSFLNCEMDVVAKPIVPVGEILSPIPKPKVLDCVPPILIEEVVMNPCGLRNVAVIFEPVAALKAIEVFEASDRTPELLSVFPEKLNPAPLIDKA